jgi:uncharacterized protein (DUF58 family)
MFKVRAGFWIFISLILLSLGGILKTEALVYYRILFLSIGVIIVCLILALISLNGITVQRTARITRHLVGQVFEERFLIHNKSLFAKIWLEIRDQSNLVGETGSKILSSVKQKDHRSYISYSLLNRRGLIPLGPTRISSGDPLGLFQKTKIFPYSDSLLVFPYFTSLTRFPLRLGLLPGGNAMRKKTFEVTPYAAGIRDYVPSDSLNRIHWPSTAKRNRLIVKEFDQDPQSDVWIFLDSQKSVHFEIDENVVSEKVDRFWIWEEQKINKIPPETYEYGISIAASIANFALDNSHAVGIATAGQISTILPAERGSRQFIKILELLAYIQCEGDQPLSALVETQTPYFQKGSAVVMITASDDKKIIHSCIEEITHRRMNPIVIFINANSFGGHRNYEQISHDLKIRNVPAQVISRGDDITSVLNSFNK